MELPDRWYYYGDEEWRFRSGTIKAMINMHVPCNTYTDLPILADCITYRAQLWTDEHDIETSEYDSLEKAKTGCEEQIRKYLEHIRNHWERGAAITENDVLRVENEKPMRRLNDTA